MQEITHNTTKETLFKQQKNEMKANNKIVKTKLRQTIVDKKEMEVRLGKEINES